ncbi:MAG: hypothetical protein AAF432_14770, partial [Planctomycetota bacterium]
MQVRSHHAGGSSSQIPFILGLSAATVLTAVSAVVASAASAPDGAALIDHDVNGDGVAERVVERDGALYFINRIDGATVCVLDDPSAPALRASVCARYDLDGNDAID